MIGCMPSTLSWLDKSDPSFQGGNLLFGSNKESHWLKNIVKAVNFKTTHKGELSLVKTAQWIGTTDIVDFSHRHTLPCCFVLIIFEHIVGHRLFIQVTWHQNCIYLNINKITIMSVAHKSWWCSYTSYQTI